MYAPSLAELSGALMHAQQSDPLESCGVIAAGRYWPLINRATEVDTFVMDMPGFFKIADEHKIVAIVHSHVYLPPKASDGDRAGCENTGLPWLILSWPTGKYAVIEPCGYRAPLIGRQWAWGTHDCFGLVRDAFKDYTGILLPDFPRNWRFWKNGENIIADQFAKAGFVAMPQGTAPEHCDVFGMQIPDSPIVNHLGIFLTPDVMLHQLEGRLSVREVYGGIYQRATVLHLRHRHFLRQAA